jgi:hypothetical protein
VPVHRLCQDNRSNSGGGGAGAGILTQKGFAMFAYFKNHFGMVMSMIIALILSFCLASAAMVWNRLELSVELMLRNWGVAFLTIMLITLFLPVQPWGNTLANKVGFKSRTLPFRMVSNIVPTFFYNTGASLILVGVNAGFTAPFYWTAVLHDYFIMFFTSYALALIVEGLAVRIAVKCCAPPSHGAATEIH